MEDHFFIADLIARKLRGRISSAEEKKLKDWVNEDPENEKLYIRIISNEHLLSKLEIYQSFDRESSWSSIEEEILDKKVRPLITRKFMRYAAAILIPFLLMAGLYFSLYKSDRDPLAQIDEFIQPGEERAVLILSDGSKIDLQADTMQQAFSDGDARIVNQNHSLVYSLVKPVQAFQPLIYNELITPRGGRYFLTLPDGTRVWLNSATTLKFPITFSDSIRQVQLEGEAYFEVVHDAKPFIVNTERMNTRVLGTEFNVLAYREEPVAANTLVDGKVRIIAGDREKVVAPGERATIVDGQSEVIIQQVNTSLYTSWVKGKIEFSNENLDVVMRRLARWYNFEFEFDNPKAMEYHFTGRIDNQQNISSVLEMMQMTTNVTFELNKQKIIIR